MESRFVLRGGRFYADGFFATGRIVLSHKRRAGKRSSWRAQRLGQPARSGKKRLGFFRHLSFLEMLDCLGGMLASGFSNRLKNLRLGDTPQIIVDRGGPARGNHVEVECLCELIRVDDGAYAPVPGE